MDSLDAAAHPVCPHCRVLLRDAPRGYECPACGYRERIDIEPRMPPDTGGPDVPPGMYAL